MVWAITIVAVVVEVAILIAFLFTIRHNQAAHTAREKSVAELRKMVHETMTGSGNKEQSHRKRPGGWEHGAEGMRTMVPHID